MATGEWTKEEAQRLLDETTEFLKKTVKTRKSPVVAHIGFLNDVLMFLERAKENIGNTGLDMETVKLELESILDQANRASNPNTSRHILVREIEKMLKDYEKKMEKSEVLR